MPIGTTRTLATIMGAGLVALLLALSACQPAAAPAATATAAPAPTAAAPKPTVAAAAPTATAAPAQPTTPPAAAAPQLATPAQLGIGQTPRRGGELAFIVSAEPPSYDAHRETSFAALQPTAPFYSLLIRFDPFDYTKLVGDVAESWTVSEDKLKYTFKLRQGVKFHDGSTLTSRDVKASFDKIIFPPQGVVSPRKASYDMVQSIEAPDPQTVVFTLKRTSGSFLSLLASPFNYIYSADKLAQDIKWYEKNIMGTGPFTFVERVAGSYMSGKRFEDYWDKGKPYLDSFRAIFITDTAAQVAAVRGGRAQVEFRGFTPTARDDLVRALGNDILVQESPWICSLSVAFNTEKPPFGDARVRRALSLALDRWEGSKALSQVAFVKDVGLGLRPGAPFAMPEEEVVKVPGFSRDIASQREQARQLLREAGVADGFSFVLKNRNVQMPYEPVGVFLIDQWKRIGLNPSMQPLETAAYTADLRNGNYEAMLDFQCDYIDEPDLQLAKYISASRSPINYGRYEDPQLDELYDRQTRETDPEKRKQIIWEFERRAIGEQAWQIPTFWWYRIIPQSAKMKGWVITPSHYLNQDLSTVWLAQ